MIKDQKYWDGCVNRNTDSYGKCCVDVARRVMEILDKGGDFNADDLISEASKGEGITGFMAGCVADMVSKCHSRGDEFRKSWNEYWGVTETKSKGGVVNPAILTIKTKE